MFYTIKIKKFLIIMFGILCVSVVGAFSINEILQIALNDESPKQTLVIDAGHGGMDGGAVSLSGIIEKDINLAISKKIYLLSNFLGIESIMTRYDDISINYDENLGIKKNKVNDMHQRANIANDNFAFISIHQNKFDIEKYKGAQVFYSATNPNSEILARNIQNSLLKIDNSNSRIHKKASDTLYLMKNINVPAVIVETGFLSNVSESGLLTDEKYQNKLANAILNGYIKFLYN